MVGPNLPFGGLACGLVLGPLPSTFIYSAMGIQSASFNSTHRRTMI